MDQISSIRTANVQSLALFAFTNCVVNFTLDYSIVVFPSDVVKYQLRRVITNDWFVVEVPLVAKISRIRVSVALQPHFGTFWDSAVRYDTCGGPEGHFWSVFDLKE